MYNRFDAGVHPRESLQELATTLREHVDALEDTAATLAKVGVPTCPLTLQSLRRLFFKRITLLKAALGKTNVKSPTSPYPMQDSGHFTTESADSLTTGSGTVSSSVEYDANNVDAVAQVHQKFLFPILGCKPLLFFQIGNLKIQSDPESGVEDLPTPTSAATGRRHSSKARANSNANVNSLDGLSKQSVGGIESHWRSVRQVKDCSACSNHFQHWQRKVCFCI